MAKFIFRLQTLLNVKAQIENSLKNELGKAVQKLEFEKSVLTAIINEKEEKINQIKYHTTNGVTVGKLKEYSSYISLLNSKIEIQKDNINNAQKVVDKYREQLVKILKEKEMLEKLKEKKHQEYLKEQLMEEQKLNDEIISFRQAGG